MRVLNENSRIFCLILAVMVGELLVSCGRVDVGARGRVTQRTFATPQAAGDALLEAAKAGDQNALVAIFGPEGNDFVFSGDPVKDKNAMQSFVGAYEQMNRWSFRKSGDEILYVGRIIFLSRYR